MKRQLPAKVYLRVAIQLPFFLIMVWYFTARLAGIFFLGILSEKAFAVITFVFSAIVSLLVIKPSIRKEMEKINEPFSLVARDPDIPLQKEKITITYVFYCTISSFFVSVLISFPLILIGLIKFFSNSVDAEGLWELFINIYVYFYIIIFGIALFVSFILIPSFKNWHWTKHQF